MAGDATPGPSALRARTTSVVVPEREGEAGTNRALLERARQVIVGGGRRAARERADGTTV
jgi:hypothetical protein